MIKSQEPVFYQGNCDNYAARLALVSACVESSLLCHNVEIYDKVVASLEEKYGCDLVDCYKHPEYLCEIFKTLPRDSCCQIVGSIRKGLGEFSYVKPISKFLDVLNL